MRAEMGGAKARGYRIHGKEGTKSDDDSQSEVPARLCPRRTPMYIGATANSKATALLTVADGGSTGLSCAAVFTHDVYRSGLRAPAV